MTDVLDRVGPNRIAAAHETLVAIARRSPLWALALFCMCSGLATLAYQLQAFDRIGEVGYADAYVLTTVQRFQQTGIIYPARDAPAPLPNFAVYSPMLYMLLAVPGRVASWANPYLGPRIIEVTVFLLCVLVTASIARALLPNPWAWRWTLMLALTPAIMRPWILQIRGDLPAILLGLLSVRMLLTRTTWGLLLAGACAGLATQFKLTYISAMIAGFLWLALQRKWGSALRFLAAASVTSLGLYLLIFLREPHMFQHILGMRHPLTNYTGVVRLLWRALHVPVALLGLATVPIIVLRERRRWALLLIYLAVSLAVSCAAEVQAGGNVNYFFEALFLLAPMAAYGALQLGRKHTAITMSFFLAGLVLTQTVAPAAFALNSFHSGRQATREWNRQMTALHNALEGSRVFSTVATVTQLAPEPVLIEPFLASHLERIGMIDLGPVAQRIRTREFDVVVTSTEAERWRGVEHISPTLRTAIAASYQPYCVFEGWLFFRPNDAPVPDVLKRLDAVGCDTTAAGVSARSW